MDYLLLDTMGAVFGKGVFDRRPDAWQRQVVVSLGRIREVAGVGGSLKGRHNFSKVGGDNSDA